ncbi:MULTISPECIES: helix-turn-helix domain-containing protein [unclassified Sinorhizobium]|uniref:helix-turn-helix domain-containing protein n=1 Tax=unclassified Sinorhizobium TaxID=2613772 RepID=UPI003523A0FD
MIFIPLPFVVALLLFILLIRMFRQREDSLVEKRPFLFLIAVYALQSVLIGVRWGYDVLEMMPAQATLAALIPALAWVSFKGLAAEEPPASLAGSWPHLLPAVLVLVLLAIWRDSLSLTLILIALAYGGALLWLARNGPDALVSSRLDGALLSYRALQITGLAVTASAISDIIISLDFAWTGGTHASGIITLGNVIALLILGGAASVASASRSRENQPQESQSQESRPPEPTPPSPSPATEEDGAVAALLDELMLSSQIYRDPDLNLGRIARRMKLAARRVSTAVNRTHGMSVSNYVNDFRIRAACDQLLATDDPVTRVMFDSGFISKSNFNREFLRVTGNSPTDFRRRNARPESVVSLQDAPSCHRDNIAVSSTPDPSYG